MNKKEIKLSEEQKKIVELKDGQHLVLAPPGTGKTELLAHRVNSALMQGIDAKEMICLTFTNRAAKSMKERIDEKYPNNGVFIGNIHNFCFKFLFKNKLISPLTSLLDEEDSELLLEEAKSVEGYSFGNGNSALMRLNTLLKQQKLNFPKEILGHLPSSIMNIELANKVCERYELLKEESTLIDFDDLLTLTYYYLSIDTDYVLTKYSWIQVDEVQDINPIQWKIIQLISSKNAHKVFFGDYEQAIFSFMGARLERLHAIEKECKVHNLQKNFRSPSYLLQIFVDYAKAHLNPKWKKDPIPEKISNPDKNDLIIANIKGDVDKEAKFIVDGLLPSLITEDNKQTAILVRYNKSAEKFSKILEERKIEHFKISGFDLFRRKIIKDIIAFLSCLENDLDKVSWYRVFNIFAKISTLKEARHFVNSLFEIGFYPTDFLKNQWTNLELESFIESFRNKRIVIFDTETTGLDTQTDDIIQIAAVELIKGKIGNSFEVFIKTEKDLVESEKIHRISKQVLNTHGISPQTGLEKFYQFVNGDILLAHNLNYDWEILISNSLRNGIDIKNFNPKLKYDSLEISRRLYPKLKSYTLGDLISTFKLQKVNFHNALEDVKATANLIKHLANQAEKKIAPQKEFLNKNKKILQTFNNNFYTIWDEMKNQFDSQTNFTILINNFLNFSETKVNYYLEPDDKYYLSKLLRHMEIKCGNKKLSDLLRNHILEYKLYKESDLVIGDEKIIISTIHKAKGLEFENVIIPECVNDVYPNWNSKNTEEKKEDARTLYVALSRAMKRLIITTHSISINKFGKTFNKNRSCFLDCIKKHFEIITEN